MFIILNKWKIREGTPQAKQITLRLSRHRRPYSIISIVLISDSITFF